MNGFDRRRLRLGGLADRRNKVSFPRDAVLPGTPARELSPQAGSTLVETVERIRAARAEGRPVMCSFGAHTIKNGLGPVLIKLIEDGWITHLATNGAGIIHDWEIAYQGLTSEDVRTNVARGEFGTWEETGRYLNLALLVGAWRGLGYGPSIGAMIAAGGRRIVEALVIADEAAGLPSPCGACRQRLREFMGPEAPIHLAGMAGVIRTVTLGDLLPLSFGPEHLGKEAIR